MRKKLVALFLVASVATTMIPMSVFADDADVGDSAGETIVEENISSDEEIATTTESEDSQETESELETVVEATETDTAGAEGSDTDTIILESAEEVVSQDAMLANTSNTSEKFRPLEISYVNNSKKTQPWVLPDLSGMGKRPLRSHMREVHMLSFSSFIAMRIFN